ncbi:MAG: tetraacyldisaccharide 4'-kinase [Methylobacillus sp.]|jgi:tetraacyldisaccharide 4'-kinase|nr:tetraacyldisaccharide 4'-kinase [Methylobacillus sp.]
MSEWLQREWTKTSLWQILLRPLSWLFGMLAALRRLGYKTGIAKSIHLPVPVIVIGNITVGGTGKTPLVIWLAQRLQAEGWKPGIISRGYRGSNTSPLSVTPASDPALAGDEPVLVAARTNAPVFIGKDRVAAGNALLQAHPECDVIISDDGLQHYRLQRDMEIAVVDGARRFGNGKLLPAGPLREPMTRLNSADAVVCNVAENGDILEKLPLTAFCLMLAVLAKECVATMQLQPVVFRNLADRSRTAMAADFADRNLLAIAGIGHPSRFFDQLKSMGLTVESRAFPDHHAYTPADLPSGAVDAILMTEKDAVKCRAFARPEWWYLEIEAQPDDALIECILNKLRK